MRGTAAVLAVACLFPSCRRTEARKVEQVAVVPFENLSGDPSLDWVGPALARVLADQLTASVSMRPVYTEDPNARGNITQVVRGYYTVAGEQVRTKAVLRDTLSQRNLQWLEASNPVGGTGATAETLAKALDTRTRRFGTQNADALRAWGESMIVNDAARRAELLERSIVSDPNFGAAYADLAQVRLASGDRDGALEVAKRADDRLSNFTDLDRTRVELVQAGLRGDQEQRRKALVAFSRLVSTDLDALRSLAELELNARRFDTAVEVYRNAVALDPENPGLLNQLAYAEVYNGNVGAARDALERYRTVDSNGLNAVDSLGEVHFIAGKFAESEKYFLEGARLGAGPQAATEFLKAAQARLLQGNTAGADELYGRYEETLKASKNPLVELRRAQWMYIAGRQQDAIALAERATEPASPEALAYWQLQAAFWKLEAGDRKRAAELAADVMANTRNPGFQRMAALARSAADGTAAPGDLGIWAQGWAAIAAKGSAQAAALLKPAYERSPPSSDAFVRTLYAQALAESGKPDAARTLVSRYFIPIGSSDDALLATGAFSRFLKLRSTLGMR